jgi:hypothetical protein
VLNLLALDDVRSQVDDAIHLKREPAAPTETVGGRAASGS